MALCSRAKSSWNNARPSQKFGTGAGVRNTHASMAFSSSRPVLTLPRSPSRSESVKRASTP